MFPIAFFADFNQLLNCPLRSKNGDETLFFLNQSIIYLRAQLFPCMFQRIYEGPCQFDQKKAKVKVDKRYTIATNVDPISNEVVYAKYLNDIGPLVAIINADGFRVR
jgi:hypothetical protein